MPRKEIKDKVNNRTHKTKTMKKFRFLALALAAAAICTSCGKGGDDPEPAATLSISPDITAVEFSYDGQQAFNGATSVTPVFTVTTDQSDWQVAVTPSTATWCQAVKTTDGSGFTLYATENAAAESPAPATVTVTAGGAAATIAVTQRPAPSSYTAWACGSYYDADYKYYAWTWKQGDATVTDLPMPAGAVSCWASQMTVSGGDIYIAGNYTDTNGKAIPGYWKNNTFVTLPLPSGVGSTQNAYCNAIVVSGGKVHASGYYGVFWRAEESRAIYWVDGTPSLLPLHEDYSLSQSKNMVLSGGSVYIGGEARLKSDPNRTRGCYWKDSQHTLLPVPADTRSSECSAIAVLNGTVYAVGRYVLNTSYAYTVLWDADGPRTLTPPEGYYIWSGGLVDIVASGGNIYIAATLCAETGLNAFNSAYWEGDECRFLGQNASNTATLPRSVFVAGGKTYLAATSNGSMGIYFWLNDNWVTIPRPAGSTYYYSPQDIIAVPE